MCLSLLSHAVSSPVPSDPQLGQRSTLSASSTRGVLTRQLASGETVEYTLSRTFETDAPAPASGAAWLTHVTARTWAQYPPVAGDAPTVEWSGLADVGTQGEIYFARAFNVSGTSGLQGVRVVCCIHSAFFFQLCCFLTSDAPHNTLLRASSVHARLAGRR